MDPPLAPTVREPGCPPVPQGDHWYGGLGVSLGESETWKIQKVGGRGAGGWTRCHWYLVLSHVAQDTARSWFWGCLTQTAHLFRHFWSFLIHIMELEGNKGLFVTEVTADVHRGKRLGLFGRFQRVSGPFWAKKGCFGAEKAQFWEGTSRLGAPAPAPGCHR